LPEVRSPKPEAGTLISTPLYVICDADVCRHAGWTLIDFASACLDGGARLLQVRAKTEPSGRLLDDTLAIVERAADQAQVIVNDRADVARLCRAAGVHVGQEDLSPDEVRRILGGQSIVGRSTHTTAQLDMALSEPISYVAIGPVFATSTKSTGYDALGLAPVRDAARRATARGFPLVAIGGITLDRAEAVLDQGAAAVAVIGDLLVTNDPQARVRAYLDRLSRL
jgi:thiamine-phosphate pyrophosphorylase